MHIPDRFIVRIVRLGKEKYEDYKKFVREAVEEKLRREEDEAMMGKRDWYRDLQEDLVEKIERAKK